MRIRFIAMTCVAGLAPAMAPALTVSVGSGSGCDHASLQSAFNALDGEPGSHAIHLRKQTFAIPDGVTYQPTVAQGTVTLEGGYAECTDAAPAGLPDDGAVLDASGGLPRPVMRLLVDGLVGSLQIRRVAIQGGDANDDANAYNGAGGGLSIRGPASVLLGTGAIVRNNHAVAGGGIALVGGQLSSLTPNRIDLYLVEGASVINNEAVENGGGIYCGGASANGDPTFSPRHGAIVLANGTIGFNATGGLGGAFYCHGTVEGGGGFQPRPGNGEVALLIGNRTNAGGTCAAGSGTLDALLPMDADGYRPIGALDGTNGIVAVANNEGTRPALCLASSRTLGSDDRPEGPSTFRLQNLVVTGQHGSGDLGLVVGSPELKLRVQPSGRHTACSFFTPTPCVSFVDNMVTGSGDKASVITSIGTLELVRASVRNNLARSALVRSYLRPARIESSLFVGNTVEAAASSPGRAAFEAGFGDLYMGDLTLMHSTAVFSSPLDVFLDLTHADSTATVRASILASTTAPAPATLGGAAPPSHLRREWCGFFQDTSDFAAHTEVPDPTSGTFVVLSPSDLSLAAETYAPGVGLVDWCTHSIEVDYHGAPFGSVVYFPGGGPADIGAVENRDDVIFTDGFDS